MFNILCVLVINIFCILYHINSAHPLLCDPGDDSGAAQGSSADAGNGSGASANPAAPHPQSPCDHPAGVPCVDTPNHSGPSYQGKTAQGEPSEYARSIHEKRHGICCKCGEDYAGSVQIQCRYCSCVQHISCMSAKDIANTIQKFRNSDY